MGASAADTARMGCRLLRLRYPATCSICGTALATRASAWWDSETKTARCMSCEVAPDTSVPEEPPVLAVSDNAPAAPPRERRRSLAGGSAQLEFERRKAKRDLGVRSRHPRVGGLILALTEEPRTTTNWAKGAEGERKLGAGLDGLASSGVVVLHDRLRPGTTANIDHLAVTPSGVWVIDAKQYKGQVAKKDVGGWLSIDIRLYVGRRDCTAIVAAMSKQVAAVRTALGPDAADVPVRPMICFVDAEWSLFARPFELGGVLVTWPQAARELLVRPGPRSPVEIDLLAARLEAGLRPAS